MIMILLYLLDCIINVIESTQQAILFLTHILLIFNYIGVNPNILLSVRLQIQKSLVLSLFFETV